MTKDSEKILLAHGGGGILTEQLLKEHLLPELHNKTLNKLEDSALLKINSENILFTTDSYVIKPLFFNGGDIGKLAVCGTVNDLAVCGSKPLALSLSFIIEEGFEIQDLDRILKSISETADKANVKIVTGDTKTVEKGACDGIFINTAGIGIQISETKLGIEKIKPGDKVLINGPVGNHGITVMCQKQDIHFDTTLESDCAPLNGIISDLIEQIPGIKFMRDPTRGGIAMTLNEITENTGLSIEIDEETLPVDREVQAAADILGFDILNIANEGKFISIVAQEYAEQFIEICKDHQLGKKTLIIGEIKEAETRPAVEMITTIGGKRIIQKPYGRELPRIC